MAEGPDFRLTFTGAPVDRAAELRTDARQIAAFLAHGAARFLPVWMLQHPFDETPRARVLDYNEAAACLDLLRSDLVFLGLVGDAPWFAVGVPDTAAPPNLNAAFKPLTEVAALLPGDEAALLSYARAMTIWHGNHRHCGRCGSPAISAEGGHSRLCINTACGHRAFPRTDPAVITLIEDPAGERCLLGRQAKWIAGQYSVIAGFVEPGESLEEAVMRESVEETGVTVTDVRYVASQPWPFPSSIMLGFRARAVATAIQRRDGELEDCRWFSRADLRAFGQEDTVFAALRLPRTFSIARHLIEAWLAER